MIILDTLVIIFAILNDNASIDDVITIAVIIITTIITVICIGLTLVLFAVTIYSYYSYNVRIIHISIIIF